MLPLILLALAPLAVGASAGLALGLTGGGGSVITVPLLVYGLGLDPHEAIGISLAAVGATSLSGALIRLRTGDLDLRAGTIFALGGWAGAPAGAWLAHQLPAQVLLGLFTVLMVTVALRMWRSTRRERRKDGELVVSRSAQLVASHSSKRRSWLHILALVSAGVATGILAGLFGVGGGIIIVPALLAITETDIRRAVGTSLWVVALVSAAGVAAHLLSGEPLETRLAAFLAAGGLVGLVGGIALAHRLSALLLRRVFAATVLLVAAWTLASTVIL